MKEDEVAGKNVPCISERKMAARDLERHNVELVCVTLKCNGVVWNSRQHFKLSFHRLSPAH